MRVFLFALMIALLPLRGWVGNAMAVDMAAQQVHMVAALGDAPAEAMPEDCPMRLQAADPSGSTSAQGGGMHCSCDTCELCLALASFSGVYLPASHFTPVAGLVADGIRFDSADRATHLKPPIS